MNLEHITDLVISAQSGDESAMEQLLLHAHTPVSYLTQKILQNNGTSQQITREVLETVSTNLTSLRDASQFEQWLCRMTAARCVQASPLLHRNFAEASEPAFWEDNLEDGAILTAEESADAIQNMVDYLPEGQRLCILLLSCGELTVPAIAQLTGFSETSIKQNIKLGQHTIQQHLWELDSRDIQFTGLSSLTEILHDAMYHSPNKQAAMKIVYAVLDKDVPVSLSTWAVRILTILAVLLAVAVVGLGAMIVMKMAGSMLS